MIHPPSRRILLAGAACLATPALAQPLPERPVRLIVPAAPGAIADLVARMIAERAAVHLGQSIVIENRPGANGNVAGEALARGAPDGRTLLCASLAMLAVNPLLLRRVPWDAAREFRLVMPLASTPHVLVATPSGPQSFTHLAVEARRHPDTITWGTAGPGSAPHLTMLLAQEMVAGGLQAVHFRGTAANLQAVVAGRVATTAEALPLVLGPIREGRLRPLLTAADTRLALLPEVQAAGETAFAGLTHGAVAGLVAPRGTPDAIVATIAGAFAAALAEASLREDLAQQGTVPLDGDGAAFQTLVQAEAMRWEPLVAHLRER